MNTIDTGFTVARATLNITSVTLSVLAEAITREPTAARALEVSRSLRDVSRSLSSAFDQIVIAETANTARFNYMQEQIRSLTHQLDYIKG